MELSHSRWKRARACNHSDVTLTTVELDRAAAVGSSDLVRPFRNHNSKIIRQTKTAKFKCSALARLVCARTNNAAQTRKTKSHPHKSEPPKSSATKRQTNLSPKTTEIFRRKKAQKAQNKTLGLTMELSHSRWQRARDCNHSAVTPTTVKLDRAAAVGSSDLVRPFRVHNSKIIR
jgi:hypothetical protein